MESECSICPQNTSASLNASRSLAIQIQWKKIRKYHKTKVCKTMLLSEQEAVLKEFWLILDFWNIYFVQPPFTSQYWVDWFLALWAESRALDLAFKVFYWRHVVKMKVSVIEESREPIWWAPDWNGFSCYQRPSSTATRYTLTYTVMYTPAYNNLQYTKLCKGSFHLRFSGIRPLRGYPPPLNGKSVWKKEGFFP